MSTLDEWLATVQESLRLPAPDTELVLDLARDVAHGVTRTAAPLTTYLLGFAAARSSADPAAVAAQIRALLPEAPAAAAESEPPASLAEQ
ncbi:MAG: hypothetical protein QOH99_1102 [Frankiaceae bacterium]|nr:hypothetical protein [Frankiaceae bacterium]